MIKKINKPWGYEEWWAFTNNYVAKLLFIKNGHKLSLQYHKEKEETMRIISGICTFTLNDKIIELLPGSSIHIPPNTIHRVEARNGDVEIIEVSTIQVDDIVRLEDDYDRMCM